MDKIKQKVVNEITEKIDHEIVGDRKFSDEEMIEALEEISAWCEGAVEAKREELRG